MRRFRHLSAACAVLVVVLAGCAETTDRVEVEAGPTDAPDASAVPSALVGQWTVDDSADDRQAVVNLSAGGGMDIFLACGVLSGGWDGATGGLFVADSSGGSGQCFPDGVEWKSVAPGWVAAARGFALDGERRSLLDAGGSVLVRLERTSERPEVADTVSETVAEVPTLDEQARVRLDAPPNLPDDVDPAGASDLIGRWELPKREKVYVEFDDDGTYKGSDGCNGSGGRWAAREGALIATSGPQTQIGCDNVDALPYEARAAGIDEGALVLHDATGDEVRRLVRAGAATAKPTATQGPTATSEPAAPARASEAAPPSALVGRWRVQDSADERVSVANVYADGRLELVLECGVIDGTWDGAVGGLFVGDLLPGRSSCYPNDASYADVTPYWVASANRFDVDGDRRIVRDAAGKIVVRLTPAAKLPAAIVKHLGEAPTVDAVQRAALDAGPVLPAGVRPAETAGVIGDWEYVGETPASSGWISGPSLGAETTGRYRAYDGCNKYTGSWALGGGALAQVINRGQDESCARLHPLGGAAIGMDGDVLVVYGADGGEILRLIRSS